MKKISFLVGLAIIGLVAYSCSDDQSNTNTPDNNAKLELRLTDAPANFDAVFIDLQGVSYKMSDGEWQTYSIEPKVYDLLELNNGVDAVLGNEWLPTGHLEEIRLVLGDNNKIVIDGVTHNLDTPSAQQSGLKVKVNTDLVEGNVYKMWLDFDAAKSIVERGNGTYGLKPVIRAFTELTNGRIEGNVLPTEALATVYAIQNVNDTIASSIPNENGYFKFMGMEEGTYSLKIDASNEVYNDTLIENVLVQFGQLTTVPTITLKLK